MTTPALRDHEDTKYTKATSQMRLSNLQLAFWCGAVVLVALTLGCEGLPASQEHPPRHHIAKRQAFYDLECKGIYEAAIFFKVDNVCSDCFSLFREYELHALCRDDCFQTPFFKGCLQALQLQDQEEDFDNLIEYIGKRR